MSDQLVQVSSFKIGTVVFTSVTDFTYAEAGTTVTNKADSEIYGTGKFLTDIDVTWGATGIDQQTFAGAVLGGDETVEVKGKSVSSGSEVTITVVHGMVVGFDIGQSHSSEGTATMSGEAHSADGTTSPISFS